MIKRDQGSVLLDIKKENFDDVSEALEGAEKIYAYKQKVTETIYTLLIKNSTR